MPRTTKKPQKAVYLPSELIERVRQSADKNRRSWNAEVQVALEFYLEQQDMALKENRRGEVGEVDEK